MDVLNYLKNRAFPSYLQQTVAVPCFMFLRSYLAVHHVENAVRDIDIYLVFTLYSKQNRSILIHF